MIVYGVATKVLDKEIFSQHAIADLIPGITLFSSVWRENFITLFSSVWRENFTVTGNKHTGTQTYTHTNTQNTCVATLRLLLMVKNTATFY